MPTPSNPQPPPNPSTQIRVQAQRRLDGVASIVYTPDLIYVIDAAGSPPAPYSIVMTGANGLIDPSLLPPSTPILLETNYVPNTLQNILNLIAGNNIILTANAFGAVTIAASSMISTSFANITSGTNIQADMIVSGSPSGTAILTYADGGVVNANEIGTINVDGNLPTHAGMILVSQPGNTAAIWVDPQVQGLYQVGSYLASPPAYAPPTTIQPILIGGESPSGQLTNIQTTPAGTLITVSADEQEAASILTFSANTGITKINISTRRPILSIQPKPGSSVLAFLLRKMRLVGNGGTALFELVLNGTLTGAAFNPVDPSSGAVFDTAATHISGGRVVDSGYLNLADQAPDYLLYFGSTDSPSTLDTFTLVVTSMTTRPNPVSASFRWTEQASSF
jgi:hypothetical protein